MDEQQEASRSSEQDQGTEQTQDQTSQDPNVPFEPSGFPSFDRSANDAADHDLSYLEGPPSADPGLANEPQRYFQGLASNAYTLGIPKTDLLKSDVPSPFNSVVSATADHSNLPISLRPTRIQHLYPHHPFFDCIPIPEFRERAILAAAANPPLINRFDVCYDMFAGGLTYIGDPSLEQSWRFSEAFQRKWDALLHIDLRELQRLADQGGSAPSG